MNDPKHDRCAPAPRTPSAFQRVTSSRSRRSNDRGGALLEFAIALPILLVLVTLIFDVGLGFSAARSTSAASRSAAHLAASAGDARQADFLALDAVRAEFEGSGDEVSWVSVFRSPANSGGAVPAGCAPGDEGLAGVCNVYAGAVLATLDPAAFDHADCMGDIDEKWCPTSRLNNNGDFLGVAVWTRHEPTVGLIRAEAFELADSAVFAIYIAPGG